MRHLLASAAIINVIEDNKIVPTATQTTPADCLGASSVCLKAKATVLSVTDAAEFWGDTLVLLSSGFFIARLRAIRSDLRL